MAIDRLRIDFPDRPRIFPEETMKFRDLRAILQYVPQFRGRTFVVALDGAVVDSAEFSNILLDLAVLRSLNIRVILVHGASAQIAALGKKREIALSNIDGTGTTDEQTLEVSMDAISRLSHSIMQSLTTVKINAAMANAIHAYPAGVIRGEDAGFTGTIERVDGKVLQGFLDQDILPVVPALGFDSDGGMLRLNSDVVARLVGIALNADKIIYISLDDPPTVVGAMHRQWSHEDGMEFLEKNRNTLPSGIASKIYNASRATHDGIPRVHLVGSRQEDALLAELFSNEGVGVMLFSDAYQKIRPARKTDVDELHLLIHRGVEEEQLIERSRAQIAGAIDDYIVLEIDGNVVGCVAVHPYPEDQSAELACLYVKAGHKGQNYGGILIKAAVHRVKEANTETFFALSTQAAVYLEKNGFQRSNDLERLPSERRTQWDKNGRNAVLLIREM